MHRPPAARFYHSVGIVWRFENNAGLCPRCHSGIPTAHPVCHPDGATVGSDWRDLQPGIAAVLEGRAFPWRRPHEGIFILWETTFSFQRAKPIVVSPFENPFPTRGRGPWTPRGAAGRRWFLRMPSTGRDAPTASCSVLGFCWHRVAFWGQGGVLFSLVAGIPGWRSLQSPLRGSVGMTVIWNRRDSSVAAAAGPCPICHPERAARAEGSPCWNRCRLGW